MIASPYDFPIGDNVVSINATDSAGNDAVEEQFTLRILPPVLPDAPVITTADINSNRSMTIGGTAVVDATVRVTFPDLTFQEVTATGGTFSVTSGADMLGGTVSVTATDARGYTSQPATVALFPDYAAPTASITSTQVAPTNAALIPVTVTFSESVTGFASGDVSVAGGAVSNFAGSGASYSFDLSATGDGTITVDIPAGVAQDAAGNDNAAAPQFSILSDQTAPGLTITGIPETFLPGDVFSVVFSFPEAVTGFEASDVTVTGGKLSGFSGSGASYNATVTPDGNNNVTVSVAAGAATDTVGNPSTAASVTGHINSALVAGKQIARFLENRTRSLVQNQPSLTGILSGRQKSTFNAEVTRGFADISIRSGSKVPLWFSLQGSRTEYDDGSGDTAFGLATIGAHAEPRSGVLLGAMVQFDFAEENQVGGVGISGRGWLAGPYLVMQHSEQPLYFEGRLLYGTSHNEISPFGTFTDEFDTERLLAMVAVEGSYETDRLRYFPRLKVSHVAERQLTYADGLSNMVPEQTVSLTEVSAGIDFEMPILLEQEGHLLTWGFAGIWSRLDGNGPASTFIDETDGGRGRINLGYRYDGGDGFIASVDAFADGLGSSSFRTYGMTLGLQARF